MGKITLKELKTELNKWQWEAKRQGWGWRYYGEKDERKVEVYPVSQLCGYTDDEYETRWMVNEAGKYLDYDIFRMMER